MLVHVKCNSAWHIVHSEQLLVTIIVIINVMFERFSSHISNGFNQLTRHPLLPQPIN